MYNHFHQGSDVSKFLGYGFDFKLEWVWDKDDTITYFIYLFTCFVPTRLKAPNQMRYNVLKGKSREKWGEVREVN